MIIQAFPKAKSPARPYKWSVRTRPRKKGLCIWLPRGRLPVRANQYYAPFYFPGLDALVLRPVTNGGDTRGEERTLCKTVHTGKSGYLGIKIPQPVCREYELRPRQVYQALCIEGDTAPTLLFTTRTDVCLLYELSQYYGFIIAEKNGAIACMYNKYTKVFDTVADALIGQLPAMLITNQSTSLQGEDPVWFPAEIGYVEKLRSSMPQILQEAG